MEKVAFWIIKAAISLKHGKIEANYRVGQKSEHQMLYT